MSAQPQADYHNEPVTERAQTPGRRLRDVRQRRGLTIERIAAELHLKPAAVAALEQDDYQALPGPVFVVGYMRNYARLMNIDPEPLLAAYRATHETTAPTPIRATGAPGSTAGGGAFAALRAALLVLLVAVAAIGVIWWQTQSPFVGPEPQVATAGAESAPPDQATAEEDSAPPDVPAPDGHDETPNAVSATAGASPIPAASPTSEARSSTSDQASAAAPAEPAPPAAPAEPAPATAEVAGQDEAAPQPSSDSGIAMEFSGPCWIDVRDSEHRFKLFGEMHQGDRRVLEGKPPYSMILGNAAAVKITVNGSPIDLKRYTRGNVARFKLDPNNLP
jgi:cytoskeleton protein RodZ